MDYAKLVTPEGRWEILQEWLDENPKNRNILEAWLEERPEEIWSQLREIAAKYLERHGDNVLAAVIRVMPLTDKAHEWIILLKDLYKARAAQDSRPAVKVIKSKRKRT